MATGFLGLNVSSWALAATTISPLIQCIPAMFEPKSFMGQFAIPKEDDAKMIGKLNHFPLTCVSAPQSLANIVSVLAAFCLVAINGFDLLAAIQNDRTVTLYSVAARLVATALFSTLGEGYKAVAPIEFATAVLISAGLAWDYYSSSTGLEDTKKAK